MTVSNYLILSFLLIFSIFCWQHVARQHNWKWKPTYFLDLATEQLVRIWNFLGRICVWISSFYTWIDPADLLATANELGMSIYHFVFSWKAFFESYVSNMNLYDHPYLISFGTATLVALLSYGTYLKYNWFSSIGSRVTSFIYK